MPSLDLTSYSRETLEHMLLMLKGYKNSLKQIGKRSVLFDPKNPPSIQARVEYAPSIETSFLEKYASACIASLFPEYSGTKPFLQENKELKGGIRVFVGDDMTDISFQRFETLVKQ